MSSAQDDVSHRKTNIGDYLPHTHWDSIHITLYTRSVGKKRKEKVIEAEIFTPFFFLFGNSLYYAIAYFVYNSKFTGVLVR